MDEHKNLFGDIRRTQDEMEHLMRHMFGKTLSQMKPIEQKWKPNVDVYECEDRVIVIVEIAGVAREDISVVFEDGKLRISGVRRDTAPYTCRKYCQMEIEYNQFERVVYLPENADAENISAKLDNGLMIIEASIKKPEPPKDHHIEIG